MTLEEAKSHVGKEAFYHFGPFSSKIISVRFADPMIVAYLHDGYVCNIDILGIESKPKNIEILN